MILPIRIAAPFDSLPFSRAGIAATAVVLNGATGLNIPDSQLVAAAPGTYYQTSTWILAAGFDYFSLLGLASTFTVPNGVEVSAIPVSAANPTQQLDAVQWGSLSSGQYSRVSQEMPNVFGFYLRFTPVGGSGAYLTILELQMCKK
jgi:hypothetical protein